MTPVAVALRDLDARLRATDELRKALEAGDADRARRAYESLPTWAWPATVAAAVREVAPLTPPQPARDWHPDGFGGAR